MAGNNSTGPDLISNACPLSGTVFNLAEAVFIICENVVGIAAIWKQPQLHTTANTFVCSMAVNDLVTGIVWLLTNTLCVVNYLNGIQLAEFIFFFCVTKILVYALVLTSIVHMAIIAAERYVYIAHPFVYKRHVSSKTIKTVLAIYWTLSVLYIVLVAFFNVVSGMSMSPHGFVFVTDSYVGLSLYIISTIGTGLAYGLIARIACARSRAKRQRNVISQREESAKSAWRTIRFFSLVYGLFLLLSFPAFCIFILFVEFQSMPIFILHYGMISGTSVSAVNFLALFALNLEFRRSVKQMLAGCLCRRRNTDLQ